MNPSILVIDDDPATRRLFHRILEPVGLKICSAASGREGLDRLRAEAFDRIFLDLHMPEESGVEVLKQIRAIDARVPVYVITGYYGRYQDALKDLAAAGIDFEVLIKPIRKEVLRSLSGATTGNADGGPAALPENPMLKNILVIDDDAAVRKSFQLALEDTGYGLETAASGDQGIAMAGARAYDLIFLDLKMPGLNGVETLREIRRMTPEVPVYIITAFHTEFVEELRQALADGITFELLRKPIGGEDIRTVVKGACEGAVGCG